MYPLACPCLALRNTCAYWCPHSALVPELVGDIKTLQCLSWTGPSKPRSLECPVPHFSDRETEVHITIVPLPRWQVAWARPSLSLGSFPLTGYEQFPALMCFSGHCSLYPQGHPPRLLGFGWLCTGGGLPCSFGFSLYIINSKQSLREQEAVSPLLCHLAPGFCSCHCHRSVGPHCKCAV